LLKINIVAIGREKDTWVKQACSHYSKLLSRFAHITISIIPPARESSSLSPGEIRRQESLLISKRMPKGYLIGLSENGKSSDSESFGKLLERWQTISSGSATFVIGGAFGLDKDFLSGCDFSLSLSEMTLPHQLARIILLEQLYRGFSILHNTDYHK